LVVPDSNSTIYPIPPDNATYSVSVQAQLTSAANGGLVGIYVYWKTNRDLTFRVDELDLAGQWNCIDMNYDIQYPAGTSYRRRLDSKGLSLWSRKPIIGGPQHVRKRIIFTLDMVG
jgi:hypothetical protein